MGPYLRTVFSLVHVISSSDRRSSIVGPRGTVRHTSTVSPPPGTSSLSYKSHDLSVGNTSIHPKLHIPCTIDAFRAPLCLPVLTVVSRLSLNVPGAQSQSRSQSSPASPLTVDWSFPDTMTHLHPAYYHAPMIRRRRTHIHLRYPQ